MLDIELLKNIFELIGAFSSVFIIYYALNFLMNSHIEEKHINIYGYNIKSINYCLLIILFSFYSITIIIPELNKEYYNIGFFIIMVILTILFFSDLYKKIPILYKILFISCSSGFFLKGLILFLVNDSEYEDFSKIILLFSVIIPIIISANLMRKNNTPIMQEFIFYKNVIHNNFELVNNPIKGILLSETKDEVVIESNNLLNRYKKSDIFCIKEIKESNLDILQDILKDFEVLKNNKFSNLSNNNGKKIETQIENIYSKICDLKEKMK